MLQGSQGREESTKDSFCLGSVLPKPEICVIPGVSWVFPTMTVRGMVANVLFPHRSPRAVTRVW